MQTNYETTEYPEPEANNVDSIRLSYATVRKEVGLFSDKSAPNKYGYYLPEEAAAWTVDDEEGTTLTLDQSSMEELIHLDVGPKEYSYYADIRNSIESLQLALPNGALKDGITIALSAKSMDLLAATRQARRESDFPISLGDIHRAQRDLFFSLSALRGVVGATEDDNLIAEDDTHIWRTFGKRIQNGGYVSDYKVCTDLSSDEKDQDGIAPEDKDYMDTFHYPGKVQLKIEPLKRIEIIYTPDRQSARDYHTSHTDITAPDGKQTSFDNDSLSLRIDIDELAPAGIALDIGRSAYDGGRNGKSMQRNGDLLGRIFQSVTPYGSHEYSGFTPAMKDEFRGFAEQLALRQYLRSQELQPTA